MREIAFSFLVSVTNLERSWEEWRKGAGVVLCGGWMCRRRREGARGLTKNGSQRVLRRWWGMRKILIFGRKFGRGERNVVRSIIGCFLYRWIKRVRRQTYVIR